MITSSTKAKASLALSFHLGSNCWAMCWNMADGVWGSIQLIKTDLNLPENCKKQDDWLYIENLMNQAINLQFYLIRCVWHKLSSLFQVCQKCTCSQVSSFQSKVLKNLQWWPALCHDRRCFLEWRYAVLDEPWRSCLLMEKIIVSKVIQLWMGSNDRIFLTIWSK